MNIRFSRLLLDTTVASLESINSQLESLDDDQQDEVLAQLEALQFSFGDEELSIESIDWEQVAKIIFFGALIATLIAAVISAIASLGRSSSTSNEIGTITYRQKTKLDEAIRNAKRDLERIKNHRPAYDLYRAVLDLQPYGCYVMLHHAHALRSSGWLVALRKADRYYEGRTDPRVSSSMHVISSNKAITELITKAAPMGVIKNIFSGVETHVRNLLMDIETLMKMPEERAGNANWVGNDFFKRDAKSKRGIVINQFIPYDLAAEIDKLNPSSLYEVFQGLGFQKPEDVTSRGVMSAVQAEIRPTTTLATVLETLDKEVARANYTISLKDSHIPNDATSKKHHAVLSDLSADIDKALKEYGRRFPTGVPAVEHHVKQIRNAVKETYAKVSTVVDMANALVIARGTILRVVAPGIQYKVGLIRKMEGLSNTMRDMTETEVNHTITMLDNQLRATAEGQAAKFTYSDIDVETTYQTGRRSGV